MEKSMKLIFRADGEVFQTVTVEKGERVMAIDPPEKEGHRFVEWKDLPAKCLPGREVAVDAVYVPNEYNAVFKIDGKEVAARKIRFGDPVVPPSDEAEAMPDFSGWKNVPETMPAHDVLVTATTTPVTYSLTMMVGDEVFGAYQFPAGADLTGLPTPEKPGHDFSGWNKNYKKMPHSNLTVRGVYKPHRHTLTYVIEDEMSFVRRMDFGAPIRPLVDPKRPNYTFSGWGDPPETMPDHDLTFTGRFTLNTHTLRFVLDDQLIYESVLHVGDPIKPPKVSTREGYMFSGWRGLPKSMPDEDFTAEGRHYLRKYKLIYTVDGKEYHKENLAFGTPIEKLPAPEGNGTFSGWSEIPTTMPASDVVIAGTFTEQ